MPTDKLAQKRRFRDKAREFVFEPFDSTLKGLEKSDDEFSKFLLLLREQDDHARNLMLGKEGKYKGQTMKSMVDTSRQLVAGRDYINAASYLSRFYDTINTVKQEFAKLDGILIKNKNKTLMQHMSPDTLKEMIEYYEKNSKASYSKFGFDKQASVFDWFKDQFDSRRRSMKFLEKKFPEILGFRKELETQINIADELHNILVDRFAQLSEARAQSDINAYQGILMKMDLEVSPPMKSFNAFFVKSVGPYVLWYKENLQNETPEQKEKVIEEKDPEAIRAPAPAMLDQEEIDRTDQPEGPKGGYYDITSVPDPSEATPDLPSNVIPMRPTEPDPEETVIKSVPVEKPVQKPGEPKMFQGKPLPMAPPGRKQAESRNDFITKIANMDEKDMQAIGQAILEYSHELEEQDPVASIKLLAVAEGLL